MLCTIHTALLNDFFFFRNGNVGPGFFCRSDDNLWPSWNMTEGFTSLALTHERKFTCVYAAASEFDTNVKEYIFLIVGGFLYF